MNGNSQKLNQVGVQLPLEIMLIGVCQ